MERLPALDRLDCGHRTRRRAAIGGLTATLLAGWLSSCRQAAGSGSSSTARQASGLLVYGSLGNIFTFDVAAKKSTQLTRLAVGAEATDPAWSPDGRRIVYAYTPPLPNTRGPGGLMPLPVTDLYVMNADGSDQKVLVAHEAPGTAYQSPVWAPDGRSLIVTYSALVVESNVVKDQRVEVARVPLEGGARQTLVPNAILPSLSPDGTRLAYIQSDGDGQSLAVANADGTQARVLVPASRLGGITAPRFSPDGRQIVFSAIPPAEPAATPTTSPPARAPGAFGRPGLAQGLPRVAAHGLPMDLFLINADGTNLRRLTQLGEDSPAATWSPDGQKLAILAGGGLYLMNADGSDFTSLDQRGGHSLIDWRPSAGAR